jgi:hypothetical protein
MLLEYNLGDIKFVRDCAPGTCRVLRGGSGGSGVEGNNDGFSGIVKDVKSNVAH